MACSVFCSKNLSVAITHAAAQFLNELRKGRERERECVCVHEREREREVGERLRRKCFISSRQDSKLFDLKMKNDATTLIQKISLSKFLVEPETN